MMTTPPTNTLKPEHEPDTAVSRLPRCRNCKTVLNFIFADHLCPACAEAVKKGGAND